jgi:predicted AAA+ superfamily ATPase
LRIAKGAFGRCQSTGKKELPSFWKLDSMGAFNQLESTMRECRLTYEARVEDELVGLVRTLEDAKRAAGQHPGRTAAQVATITVTPSEPCAGTRTWTDASGFWKLV